jgi:hypothetical protein
MSASRDAILASRVSRVILALTAVMSLGAAVAAAPAAPPSADMIARAEQARLDPSEMTQGVRPLAHGPAIRVGRAYDADDEDCTVVVTQTTDANGRTKVTRHLSCAE